MSPFDRCVNKHYQFNIKQQRCTVNSRVAQQFLLQIFFVLDAVKNPTKIGSNNECETEDEMPFDTFYWTFVCAA